MQARLGTDLARHPLVKARSSLFGLATVWFLIHTTSVSAHAKLCDQVRDDGETDVQLRS